jgi:hypothetical protein
MGFFRCFPAENYKPVLLVATHRTFLSAGPDTRADGARAMFL